MQRLVRTGLPEVLRPVVVDRTAELAHLLDEKRMGVQTTINLRNGRFNDLSLQVGILYGQEPADIDISSEPGNPTFDEGLRLCMPLFEQIQHALVGHDYTFYTPQSSFRFGLQIRDSANLFGGKPEFGFRFNSYYWLQNLQ